MLSGGRVYVNRIKKAVSPQECDVGNINQKQNSPSISQSSVEKQNPWKTLSPAPFHIHLLYLYLKMYYKELAQVIMEADKT